MDMLCVVLSLTKLTKFETSAIFHHTEEVRGVKASQSLV